MRLATLRRSVGPRRFCEASLTRRALIRVLRVPFFLGEAAMSTAEAYPRLLSALDEVRGRWRRQKLLEGCLLTLAGVAAVLTVLVLADNLFRPDTAGRVGLA